jgi:pyridinium-3,5-bisthiocarboxylic acid mononucleotide nickel chelatase
VRIAYVDMVGGAAGDMLLAAFLDAGLDREALERALRTVVADGWALEPKRVVKRGIAATYAGLVVPGEDGDEHHHHHHHDGTGHGHGYDHDDRHEHDDERDHRDERDRGHRHEHDRDHRHDGVTGTRTLADVLGIVARSGLSARQRERASAVYRALADAEARTHGTTAEAIRFHEIGQVDAILDVAATCVALDLLEIDELRCSPFPIGHGPIGMEHGIYPNPPPATAYLLTGWPTRALDVAGELVTPTAAAILTTLAKPGRADMTIERVGYGAGRSDFSVPNVTRVLIGSTAAAASAADEVVVIEANIDDMLPQHYELATERLFAAGARDVWLTPIVMKKGRPAITLSALAAPADEDAVARAMLTETTTIGVRVRTERRRVLARETVSVETPYGPVRVKRAGTNGDARARAEYDDLLRIARERNLPLPEVTRTVDAVISASFATGEPAS